MTTLRSPLAILVLLLAAAPAAHAEVDLLWGFHEGDHFRYRITLDQKTRMETSMMGVSQTVEQDQLQEMELSCHTDRVNEDGTLVVTWTYDRVRIKLDSPQAKVEWDSSVDPEEYAGDPTTSMFAFMREIIGRPITVVMDRQGNIHDVIGTGEMIDAIIEEAPAEVRDLIGMQLKGMLGDDQIRSSFLSGMGVFPDSPVAIPLEWSTSQSTPVPMLGHMNTAVTNTLSAEETDEDSGEGYALITQAGRMSLVRDDDADDIPGMPPGMDLDLDVDLVKGSLEGEAHFSTDRGIILRSHTQIEMEFDMVMSAGPDQSMSMNQRIRSKGSVELIEGEDEDAQGGEDRPETGESDD